MDHTWVLALAALAAVAAVYLVARNRRTSTAQVETSGTQPPKQDSAANKWLNERRRKLRAGFNILSKLRQEMQTDGLWRDVDERRYQLLSWNIDDYLDSAEKQPLPSFYAYGKLFQEGPFTSVAFNSSGWSLAWGVWMVDAHIEMLTLHALVRKALTDANLEHREWKERHLAELEKSIESAGFNRTSDGVPQYSLVNLVRRELDTTIILVNFEKTPFCAGLDEALDLVRVSGGLPDAGDYFKIDRNNVPSQDAIRSMMDAFTGAREGAWRKLTNEEKERIRARAAELN